MFAPFDPQVLKGESLGAPAVARRRLAHLRIAEIRDTLTPRREQAVDAARFAELNVRSLLVCGLSLSDRVSGFMALCSSQPRDGWDANLHLLLKLVGASFATGLERLRVERHLSQLEERNALSLDTANDGLWDFDVEQQHGLLLAALGSMLGFDESDPNISPDWRRLVHPDDMARVQAAIRDHIAGKTPMFESVHRMQHRNGEWRWVVSRAKARVDEHGPAAAPGRRRARHHRAQALRGGAVPREGERADHAAVDRRRRRSRPMRNCRVEYLNPVAEELTGWRLEDAQGRTIDEIFRGFHEETCEPLENPLSRRDPPHAARSSRVRPTLLIRRDGNELYIESTASPIRDGAGAVSGGVLVFHDVSESRELNRKLSYHASHDILTGLVNRREFEARLERALKSAKARETSYALCSHRPRPVQDHQRHLRPQRRRRAAGAGRRAAQVQDPLARHARAPRRRRVRRAARELLAGRGAAHGRVAARDDPQLPVRLGGAHVPPRRAASASCRSPPRTRTWRRCCRRPTAPAPRPRKRAATASTASRKTTST